MAVVEVYIEKILTDNQKEIVSKLPYQELKSFIEILSEGKSLTSIDSDEVERMFLEKYHTKLQEGE